MRFRGPEGSPATTASGQAAPVCEGLHRLFCPYLLPALRLMIWTGCRLLRLPDGPGWAIRRNASTVGHPSSCLERKRPVPEYRTLGISRICDGCDRVSVAGRTYRRLNTGSDPDRRVPTLTHTSGAARPTPREILQRGRAPPTQRHQEDSTCQPSQRPRG